ncbi:hypothetical protein FHS31_000833 [Sphingomonas vulcanisoli]|uniref:Uncharacterized protein n=1 Tax=Sphingomonas vulcanisoli TaxID=1658060 RepID=A0ABX0TNY4_9SPHN|nr:ATP-binding protein [Sphingomonas vulcanisoli]NIJ07237.1 hypothetical protein [Sphingomonas vulcanisoli]
MSSSLDLLGLTVAALLGPQATADPPFYATDAGAGVASPGDWPTQQDQYPRIKVFVFGETKTSGGRGGINFTVVTTIRVIGEVSKPVQINDGGAGAAMAALGALNAQIECAVINSYPLTGQLQQFPSIRSQLAFNADGATHLAGIHIDIDMEHFQSEEDFAPIASSDLNELDFASTAAPPTGFIVNLNP